MRQIVTLLITVFLIGCSNKIKNLDGFKLLPSVQEVEYNNDLSNLNFENIKFAHSDNNTELPIRFDFTNHIENNKQSESTIDYSIDSSLNLNQEGYGEGLDVDEEKSKAWIWIVIIIIIIFGTISRYISS